MKRIIPYVLPAITLIWLISLAISEPTIVGFTTREIGVRENVELETSKYFVIPGDAIIEVKINDKTLRMKIDEFVRRSGKDYEILEGTWDLADYDGEGFTGDYVYSLSLGAFGFENLEDGLHNVEVSIVYNGKEVKKDVKTIVIE